MPDYPKAIVPVDHVEPVPRRVRAFVGGEPVLDTTRARYVWEWPFYPQYYVPAADVRRDLLVDEGRAEDTRRGTARLHGLTAGDTTRAGCARWYGPDAAPDLVDTVRFDWAAADAWFGLPTRYYLNRTDLRAGLLVASQTRTSCPYKGRTSAWWSVRLGATVHPDLAWSYGFPTAALLPIAGLVAFYNEKVDLIVDGERLDRPRTHFS
ncbi:DUF427 domain-containing protein [Micromonospora sp. HK10]|uniref:DUF427 domain-containing protein n=1 Tax=Micromonospora sp. HK10 TaxID=1538294 RepID=UPI0006273EC5|nr:DUF427 domain-containing protein [Micromonospora sp. HK10]KKK07801.1 hypothetical protein LQ51_00470 [Micromonospora sp. HK10]